jgi:hypothetical protein
MRIPSIVRSLMLLAFAAFRMAGGAAAWAQEEPRPNPSATETPRATATPRDEDRADTASDDDHDRDADREGRHRRRHHRDGNVQVGAGVTVGPSETHHKDIVVMGGPVDVQGKQEGDVVVIGGPITVSGTVDGDVVAIGGPVHLKSTARVEGDAVAVGAGMEKEEGAVVEGQVASMGGENALEMLPDLYWPHFGLHSLILMSLVEWLWIAAVTLLVTLVIAAVMPDRIEATANVVRDQWLKCLGWGALTFLAGIVATMLLCITCVGAVVPYIFYKVAKFYGLAALFIVIGQALGRNGLKRDLTLLPSLLLGFLVLALIALLIPAVWWIYDWIAVGAAILTRFGTMKPWFDNRKPAPPAPLSTSLASPEPGD